MTNWNGIGDYKDRKEKSLLSTYQSMMRYDVLSKEKK